GNQLSLRSRLTVPGPNRFAMSMAWVRIASIRRAVTAHEQDGRSWKRLLRRVYTQYLSPSP
ncbi:MAG: hypothetical protein KDA92_23580, partial [Planctomycetales bacterium]|nr:hypothetical protein [Planctomycetales bacterium]